MTNARLLKLLPVAALAVGLAAAPAVAQNMLGGGAAGGGYTGGGRIGGGAGGGFSGGGGAVAPAPMTPQAPAVPRAQVPGGYGGGAVLPRAQAPAGYGAGGGYGGPRHSGGVPGINGWSGGAPAVQHRQGWTGQNPSYLPRNGWQGGRHHGRGHWRGGVWVPYVVGGYDYAPSYGVYEDDEECVMRKVRVHTRHGWKRVWRRVCS